MLSSVKNLFTKKQSKSPLFNVDKKTWEIEYINHQWDYLDSTPAERSRSAIIGMYCQLFSPNGKMLDIGCGFGTLFDFLNAQQKKKYLGIDISQQAINKAKNRKANFKNVDFNELITKNIYDIIVFNEVLFYMDEMNAFKKAINLLSKNGVIIVSQWKMKNYANDQRMWKISKNFFTSVDSIEISGKVKNSQLVAWRIDVLKVKNGYKQ
jgi:2-polyprenyl-3-methyl-5-hydroxy-6-metoxy-1,4-benzoquinol methylase